MPRTPINIADTAGNTPMVRLTRLLPDGVDVELYGKLEGCSHGYGGSMHLYDVERGTMGANAVVGGGLPAAAGAALAFKLRR